MRRPTLAAMLLGLLLGGQALAHAGRGETGDRTGHAADGSERVPHGHRGGAGPTPVPAGVTVPRWDELTPEQQAALERLRADWDQLPASRRVRALESMERRARWEAMTPEEREKLRAGARNFRDLPPELRENMRASMRATRALPEDERRALRERWHAMSPEQRRAWLQAGGPGISPPPAD